MTTSRWTSTDLPDLAGRVVVVTGASGGLGLQTTRVLAGAGARVVLAVRDVAKGDKVAAGVSGETEVRALDLADLASVRSFAEGWAGPIDVLVNNAGIMAVPEGRTTAGFELQIGTNHLGPFLLTNLLLPSISDRVVTVSSQLHRRAKIDLADLNWERRRYDPMRAYVDSKLANLLFTFELQRRLSQANSRVRALAAHPGIARTNLARAAGGTSAAFDRYLGWLFNDVERGALSIEYAATQDVPSGSYVGPGGFAHFRGYPEIHEPSAAARDPQTGGRLWELSARLTGIDSTILASREPAIDAMTTREAARR
jgi:NAD(P)-dependent dehydrogenase (short-subunit alcohol dehydrogenase family)